MEVHHHSHNPKKWSEYFTEFIMLFAAVTLGFFAENLREHQIEKHREIQYLKNIHLDLQRDLIEIDRTLDYNTRKQNFGLQLSELYAKGVDRDLPKFYYLVKSLALRRLFQHSNNGLEQLKNAGGLRLIEDDEIIQQIQLVELRIAVIETLQTAMEQTLLHFRLKTFAVLDANTSNEMNATQNVDHSNYKNIVGRFTKPVNVRPLKLSSENDINELVNLGLAPINTIRYINSHLTELKKESLTLDNMLVKKYGNEF